ncbi:F-box domain-containing protein [Leptodontidium sp. MPI-SDFR-AT-0119]|nr:F-box domain-containing protein [Leptodontidium sp. MPI-SDFR-AT-0119]
MSCEQPSPDQCISRLSCRPRHILNGMISISEAAKPSAIKRDASSSSIGLLDILPVEFSLSHLSRVSLQGNEVVRSLPAYRSLMEHAPHALAALGRTRLISLHSANALYGTLLSEQCISCGEYGAFLFLPTCERCCYECLCRNQSLWVIPTTLARKCFDLTLSQLKRLPIMRSVPGSYFVGHTISRQRQLKLTSVKAAKELGIMIHGSTENMAETLTARRSGGMTEKEYHTFRWLQDAPLHPPGQDLSRLPTEGNRYRFKQLAPTVVSDLVPPGCDAFRIFLGMQRRARSHAGFLDHITHCHGARENWIVD